MKDMLGDRMKRYESVYKQKLIPKLYTIVRIDGKNFHRFTKRFKKPIDEDFLSLMNRTAMYITKNTQNAKFGYTQSDEISLLLTDWDNINTEMYFAGNIQKITSVISSMTTAFFSSIYAKTYNDFDFPSFDCRVFQLPSRVEVYNYFLWRQKDCHRNFINSLAQYHIGKKEIKGWKQPKLITELEKRGVVVESVYSRGVLCFQDGLDTIWKNLEKFQYEKGTLHELTPYPFN